MLTSVRPKGGFVAVFGSCTPFPLSAKKIWVTVLSLVGEALPAQQAPHLRHTRQVALSQSLPLEFCPPESRQCLKVVARCFKISRSTKLKTICQQQTWESLAMSCGWTSREGRSLQCLGCCAFFHGEEWEFHWFDERMRSSFPKELPSPLKTRTPSCENMGFTFFPLHTTVRYLYKRVGDT
jgi:hypothetical protein